MSTTELDWQTPELVCRKIVSCCEHVTLRNLRLVSYHWNQTIESICPLLFVLNESDRDSVEFLQRIPVKQHTTVVSVNSWKRAFKILGENLRTVKVQCALTVDFPTNLHQLTSLTSLTLERNSLYALNFGSSIENDRLRKTSPSSLTFFNLKTLILKGEIDRDNETRYHLERLQANFSENMRYLLKSLKAPRLLRLEIIDYTTSCSRSYREDNNWMPFWEDDMLILFMAENCSNLRKLNLTCSGSKASTEKMAYLPVPKSLTKVTLRFRENEGCFMNSSYKFDGHESLYWIRLLLDQLHLRKLDLCAFADFPKKTFRQIISNNMKLLEHVNCCGLSLLEVIPGQIKIQDSCMENCSNLTKLTLGLGCLYTSFESLLQKIPRTIEELEIMCTRIPIEELQNITQLTRLKRLELIGVAFNNPGQFDNGAILNINERRIRLDGLRKILRMRSLDHINIAGFQNSPGGFYSDDYAEFCEALATTHKFGEEYEFVKLHRILAIKVRVKVIIQM